MSVRPLHISENDGTGEGDDIMMASGEVIKGSGEEDGAVRAHATAVDQGKGVDDSGMDDDFREEPEDEGIRGDNRDENPEPQAKARHIRAARMPSRAARERHEERGHCPYQPWCRICVMTRGISSPHRRAQENAEPRQIPTIGFDYCFPEGRGRDAPTEDDQEKPKSQTILVARESAGGATMAVQVPRKGAAHRSVVKYLAQWLRCLGHPRIILKGDSEASIRQLQDDIREMNQDMITIPENAPRGDSASNGLAERAIEEVEGYLRSLKLTLEEKIGMKISSGMPIMQWIVRHTGVILSQVKVSTTTGMTAYERMKGKPSQAVMLPIGERVLYQATQKERKNKAGPRYLEGIYLGTTWRSGETIVGTADGGSTTSRCIRRRPVEERWSKHEIENLKATPLDPGGEEQGERDHENQSREEVPIVPDEKPKPRRFHIRREDMEKHGATDGCPGCRALHARRRGVPHTNDCRTRMEEAMAQDPATSNRVWRSFERFEEERLEEETPKTDIPDDSPKQRCPDRQAKEEEDQPAKRRRQNPQDAAQEEPNDANPENDAGMDPSDSSSDSSSSDDSDDSSSNSEDNRHPQGGAVRARPQDDEEATAPKRQRLEVIGENSEEEEEKMGPKIAEIFSVPRVAAMAAELGLRAGSSMDLKTGWDFSRADHRRACRKQLELEKPCLVVGSPECRMFSALQSMNPSKGSPQWNRQLAAAVIHIAFCAEVYADQMARGAYFVHEQPATATSWRLRAMERIQNLPNVTTVIADLCQYGMISREGEPAKKPTKFMTNSPEIAQELSLRCRGDHHHRDLTGGRAKACAVYPRKLCQAICCGIIKQRRKDKQMADKMCKMMSPDALMSMSDENDWFWDSAKGGWLDPKLVMEAREKEIEYIRRMKIYDKVPREEAKAHGGGRPPIRVRWVDTNKGSEDHPNIRSRLVAMEIRTGRRPDLYSPTPPLECFKLLMGIVAAESEGVAEVNPVCLMHIDISRAYFHAPVTRRTYVEIPPEDQAPGDRDLVARLRASLYGTRDAQMNWERTYANILTQAGFRRGVAVPCNFYHEAKQIRITVHGDDFLASGREKELMWLKEVMSEKLEVKVKLMGPNKEHEKEMLLLNRAIRWGDQGLSWEADPRHSETIIKELGLDDSNGAAAPCTEDIRALSEKRMQSSAIEGDEATSYRRLVATANFIATDRADIQYTTRCLSKGMAKPTREDVKALRHLGRYLRRVPRLILCMPWGGDISKIIIQSDSDWAGEKGSRKSVSAGAAYVGNAMVKTWSKDQAVIALSSGEAELYAAGRAAREGLGIQSMAKELGYQMEVIIEVDASAAQGMMQRRGLGKLRHLDVQELWVQDAIQRGAFKVRRVSTRNNTADIGTKPLSRESMEKLLTMMRYWAPSCGNSPC